LKVERDLKSYTVIYTEYSKNSISSTSPTTAEDFEAFVIPELPKGEFMEFDIISTWGDKHYVGLNSIEIFNYLGKPVKIKQVIRFCSDFILMIIILRNSILFVGFG
jgi:hypothetical protein